MKAFEAHSRGQALPMTMGILADANPFSSASGNFTFMLRGIARVLDEVSLRAFYQLSSGGRNLSYL